MGVYPNGTKSEPRITSHYGPRAPINTGNGTTSAFHTGVDYVGFSEVKAVRAGTIVYAAYTAANGNEIKISHGDGTFTRYYHLARFVRTGGTVSEGETIGIMGTTGMSTGVHLHYRVDTPLGTHRDPRAYTQAHLNSGGGGGALGPTQRQVLSTLPASRRIGAPNTSAPKGEELAPNTVGNFDGWIRGESVSGNNIWFRGISGDWFWSGGFTSQSTAGLADLNPVDPKVRTVRSGIGNARLRADTNTSSTHIEDLAEGAALSVDGWKKGQAVNDGVNSSDVWFKIKNGWAWAGSFTSQSTASLTDLNVTTPPVEPEPTSAKRTVKAVSVIIRDYPTTAGANLGVIPANEVVDILGYSKGASVTSNGTTSDVWFKHSKGYSWAGGFTSQDTAGLTQITIEVPGTVLDPAQPWKNQTPDSSLAKWVGSPNYNRYPSDPTKTHITFHWMDGTLAGTDSHFQNPGEVINGRGTNAATNYGVGQTEIHQYILEKDYQHGDGDRASNTKGVSIEHEGGTTIPITKAVLDNSAKLSADIAKRRGLGKLVWMENVFPHSHWTATTCPGTLDYAYIIREANKINGYGEGPGEPTDPSTPLSERVAELEAERDTLKARVTELEAAVADRDAKLLTKNEYIEQVHAKVTQAWEILENI